MQGKKKKRHEKRQMSVKRTDATQMYCNLDVCGVCLQFIRRFIHPRAHGDVRVKPIDIISVFS